MTRLHPIPFYWWLLKAGWRRKRLGMVVCKIWHDVIHGRPEREVGGVFPAKRS